MAAGHNKLHSAEHTDGTDDLQNAQPTSPGPAQKGLMTVAQADKLDGIVAGAQSDHGGLTGLGDDDHTQYALLAGRAEGGQVLYGGTAQIDEMILKGTTHLDPGEGQSARLAVDYDSVALSANSDLFGGTATVLTVDQSGMAYAGAGGSQYDVDLSAGISGGILLSHADAGNNQQVSMTLVDGDVNLDIGNTPISALHVTAAETVFNDDGADRDFRVESDATPHMFFVDASLSRIGINTDTPSAGHALDVNGNIKAVDLTLSGSLLVQGQTVQLDSQVSTADTVIEINDGEVGAGVTAVEAGFEVDRGTQAPWSLVWNESIDEFTVRETGLQIGYSALASGPFVFGETVTGGTSGATGKVYQDNGLNAMAVRAVVGAFTATETMTGSVSGATATVDSQGLIAGFALAKRSQTGDVDNGIAVFNNADKAYETSANLTWSGSDLNVVGTMTSRTHTIDTPDGGDAIVVQASGTTESASIKFLDSTGNTNYGSVYGSNGSVQLGAVGNIPVYIGNQGAAQLRIDAGGNISINADAADVDFLMAKLTLSGAITAFADDGGSVVTVTSNGHGLVTGDGVTIAGTTNYNGLYSVISSTTNQFKIVSSFFGDDATGTFSSAASAVLYDAGADTWAFSGVASFNELVGIGTAAPTTDLHVVGGLLVANNSGDDTGNLSIAPGAVSMGYSGVGGVSSLTINSSSIEFVRGTNPDSVMLANSTETVFNDDGAAVDFRVEGGTNANQLIVDASNDSVGIGGAPLGSAADLYVGSKGIQLSTGARVDNIQTTITNTDTELPTSGAVVDYVATTKMQQEFHVVTAGDVTAGYFTLTNNPNNAISVRVEALDGVAQLSKQTIGIGAETPDFDVLSTNQVHINNTGAATGLSAAIVENDKLLITYLGV